MWLHVQLHRLGSYYALQINIMHNCAWQLSLLINVHFLHAQNSHSSISKEISNRIHTLKLVWIPKPSHLKINVLESLKISLDKHHRPFCKYGPTFLVIFKWTSNCIMYSYKKSWKEKDQRETIVFTIIDSPVI